MVKMTTVRGLIAHFLLTLMYQSSFGEKDLFAGYLGCYKDSVDNRQLLPNLQENPGAEPLTIKLCLGWCKQKGFYYAGLHNAIHCFCGSEKPSHQHKVSFKECGAVCGGNFCGGSSTLSVFEIEQDPSYLGCYKEWFHGDGKRLLSGLQTNFETDLTQQKCIEHCLVSGFAYAGTQWRIECFCSDTKPPDDAKTIETECDLKCSGDESKTCGGTSRLTVFRAGIPLETPKSAAGSQDLGCYQDSVSNRLFADLTTYFKTDLTPDKCVVHCLVQGFAYAGTEFGNECFCSKTRPPDEKKTSDSECDMKCTGDESRTCGARDRLNVYTTGAPVPQGVEDAEIVSRYLGCYSDSPFRLLPDQHFYFGYLTMEFCILFCEQREFDFAGLQAGFWCLCGNRKPSRTLIVDEEQCATHTCPSNSNQKCGGEWKMNVFKTKMPDDGMLLKRVGCFKDSKSRILSGYHQSFPRLLTIQRCVRLCRQKGYHYAGMENGNECFCGSNALSFKDYAKDEECSRRCEGNHMQTCGGDWKIEIYKTGLKGSLPTSDDGKYIGCYIDSENIRSLNGHYEDFGNFLTPLICTGLCYSKGFLYSGTQASTQCFCGDETPTPNFRAPEGDCSRPCFGNMTQKCGGDLKNSIRETGIPELPTTGKYLGCYHNKNHQILKDVRITTFEKTNSPRRCMNFCGQLGFRYSGVEYGKECICGNELPRDDLAVNDDNCNIPCAGNPRETCGGDGQSAVYATSHTDKVLPLVVNTKPNLCIISETIASGKESCRGEVVFEDTFDSPLDTRWSHVVLIQDAPDFEFAVFNSDPKNSFTRNSMLVLKPTVYNDTFVTGGSLNLKGCTGEARTRKCGYQAASYNILPPVATARLHTRESFSFRYGIVEIRAKLPLGDWLVPELWLEPVKPHYGPAYESGRIRIAMNRGNTNLKCDGEDLGSNRLESGVVMGPANNVQRRSLTTKLPPNWHNRFHNYTLIWAPDSISFKIDNEQAQELVPAGKRLCEVVRFKHQDCLSWSSGTNIAPFDQDFYVSLGLSVGNAWDFPNECVNRGKPKPWKNLEVKGMLKFWQDKGNWQATWTEDKSALYIEHVRVTAL